MTHNKKIVTKEEVKRLIELNPDSRQYFFTQKDDQWFEWLRDNGFLDVIKQKPDEAARFMPELEYLVKVAETKPEEVVDFMLAVEVPVNFNYAVVSRFLWICTNLAAPHLARMVPKIRDEEWVQRMANYSHWAFEYKKMFDTLSAAGDQDSLIELARAVVSVRTKEELGTGNFRSKEQPFYYDDVSETGVFDHIARVDDAHAEAAFGIATEALGKVTLLGAEKEDDVFSIGEIFALYDIDFFTVDGGRDHSYSPKEDVKELATAARKLAERLIGAHCGSDTIRPLHDKYIAPLPDARTIWRFRLLIWSLCPKVFNVELKAAFFKVFEVGDKLWPIIAGAEYERALQKGFATIPEKDQREYVRQLLPLFSGERAPMGHDIASSIFASLTPEEKKEAEKQFGRALNPEYVPNPTLSGVTSGFIDAQEPPNADEEWVKSVPEIIELLKTKWSPHALRALDTKRDFLHPINAEGVASRLQEEIKKRPAEYLNAATLFFDRDALDAHYTYSFLRGVAETVKAGKPEGVDWTQLMALFDAIVTAGHQTPLAKAERRREADTWLSDWQGVHDAVSDLLQNLLSGEADFIPFEANRDALFALIAYLLEYPDPLPQPYEAAKKNEFTGREEYTRSDPFTEAINSVRGRGFQALAMFVYPDGKRFAKDAVVRLAPDVKKLYETALANEKTEAVMFLFGHYLPPFYYRDKEWMRPLLSSIFPLDAAKKDLMLAAAEGYLTSSLHIDIFDELDFLYKHLISLKPEDFTPRRYFGEIDETIATHIALAYMHFDDFDLNSALFRSLWWCPVPKRRQEFVSFVGRSAISRENAKEWCAENRVKIEKLQALWDWILQGEWIQKENDPDDREVFAEFGFWMNTKANLFDVAWLADRTRQTLEKSKGRLDREYEMMESMPEFVKTSPRDALTMLKLYIEATLAGEQRRNWLHVDQELVQFFRDLYQMADEATKKEISDFINSVVRRGGAQYWLLREALK